MLIRLPQRVQDLDRKNFSANDEQSNCGLCPGARAERVEPLQQCMADLFCGDFVSRETVQKDFHR